MLRLSIVCLVAAAFAFGQSAGPSPSFDVADIKVNNSGATQSHGDLSNGRLIVTNFPLRFLLAEAWTMTPDDIHGPSWLDAVRVDVAAKTAEGPRTSDADLRLMVRTLLKDRMKLVAHMEDREEPVWALTVWKGQAKMTPSEMPAKPEDADCSSNGAAGHMACKHMTMAMLAHELPNHVSGYVDKRVVDQTGLAGAWDFTLDWTPMAQLENSGGVTLVAAMRAQIGLQLESRKLLVPVLVVDSMARTPTDN